MNLVNVLYNKVDNIYFNRRIRVHTTKPLRSFVVNNQVRGWFISQYPEKVLIPTGTVVTIFNNYKKGTLLYL